MTKAQIVSYDFGRHNANLEESRSRVMHGGSWKKQRTIVMLPSSDMIPAKVALSHWNLIFPPNQPMWRMLCLGMEVGEAYTSALYQIVGHPDLTQWEYVLSIEHDNIPPPDGLLMLIKDLEEHKEYAAISGLYWHKGEGGYAHIWGDPKDPVLNYRPQVPKVDELQECCGLSMGFTLWRLSLFKDERLKKPWFKTHASKEGVGTQDLAFWTDARKYGYRCAVDTKVKVGHFDIGTGDTW